MTAGLQVPQALPGQVYVIEDIADGQPQMYFTDVGYRVFYTQLGNMRSSDDLQHIAIAKQVVVTAGRDGMLAGIWFLDLPSDIALVQANLDQNPERPQDDNSGTGIGK